MAKDVSKTILIGRVGKDPEVRTFNNGNKGASFSLCTNGGYKDKSGTWVDKLEWHNIEIFGRLVDIVEKYVNKGDRLYVEGRIDYQQYEKDGETKYVTKINVFDLTMLGKKSDGSGSARPPQQDQNAPAPDEPDFGSEDDEDDLPF